MQETWNALSSNQFVMIQKISLQILYNKLWYTSFSETGKEDRLAITAVSSSSSSSVAVVTVVLY
jgi:hypothetical protein